MISLYQVADVGQKLFMSWLRTGRKRGQILLGLIKYAPSAPLDFLLSSPLSLLLKVGPCDLPARPYSPEFLLHFSLSFFLHMGISTRKHHRSITFPFTYSGYDSLFLVSICTFPNSKSTLQCQCHHWSTNFNMLHTFLYFLWQGLIRNTAWIALQSAE